MSRYGRLFDATVRSEYERALVLERLGPVNHGDAGEHQRRLAAGARHQGPPGRGLLRAGRGAGAFKPAPDPPFPQPARQLVTGASEAGASMK